MLIACGRVVIVCLQVTKDKLMGAMEGHVLGEAELIAVFHN